MPRLLRQRRPIAALLLVAFAAAATGVPLPRPQLARLSTERFPCENCGCGCNSADVCWTNCCCHTMAQRLEWARSEAVRPPEEVLQLALSEGHDVRPWIESTPPAAGSCCASPAPAAKASCCCCCKPNEPSKAVDKQRCSPLPRTSIWQVAACQGSLKLWLSITVAPYACEPCETNAPPCESIAATNAQLVPLLGSAPPTPPPKSVT